MASPSSLAELFQAFLETVLALLWIAADQARRDKGDWAGLRLYCLGIWQMCSSGQDAEIF